MADSALTKTGNPGLSPDSATVAPVIPVAAAEARTSPRRKNMIGVAGKELIWGVDGVLRGMRRYEGV